VNPSVYKEIQDPFTGEPVIAIPPLCPDVALIHFTKCDEYGNCFSLGGRHMEDVIAKAAKRVIVSAEKIVEPDEISAAPTQTAIPGVLVDAVVHAPYGAYPGTCPGLYGYDRKHLEHYQALASKGRTREYLEQYVYSSVGDAALLEAVGKERLASLHLG
jgi:glutaconate CoA-transferase, subunit A